MYIRNNIYIYCLFFFKYTCVSVYVCIVWIWFVRICSVIHSFIHPFIYLFVFLTLSAAPRPTALFILLQVLTKDSVTVSVDAVVYYRVSNATVSIANVENAHHSTRLLAQTTLRNTMGTQHLHEILSERMTISDTMQVRAYSCTFKYALV